MVHVRLKRAFVAGLDVGDAFADRNHFKSELMTGSARISEERKFSEVARKVGATNAHSMSAHNSLTGCGIFLVRAINDGDFFRFGEFDSLHKNSE